MRLSLRSAAIVALVVVVLVGAGATMFVGRVSAFVARKTGYRIDFQTAMAKPSPMAIVASAASPLNVDPPSAPSRLVFVHHSVGEGWLADSLRAALNANNYYVSDVSYGWGPPDADVGSGTIGDHTDIGDWYDWFVGPNRDTYLEALFATANNAGSNQKVGEPGGESNIVMFKSCFPNSGLYGKPNDPPTTGSNPLRSQSVGSPHYTVANAKGIYNDLLSYFATRQDKLFIVVTAPPLVRGDTDPTQAANARAFNRWLATEWLASYPKNNVAVFDFYSVLTSNAGDPTKNDLGAAAGDHHRYQNGAVEYITGQSSNYAAYPLARWDSHPNAAGYQKATAEFVPLLNAAVNCWGGKGGCPPLMGRGAVAQR